MFKQEEGLSKNYVHCPMGIIFTQTHYLQNDFQDNKTTV